MKLNKKIFAINLLASALLVQNAYADKWDSNVYTPDSSSSGSSTTTVEASQGEGSSNGTIEEGEKCVSDPASSKNFPLKMINKLTRDGSGVKFSIDEKSGRVNIEVPPIITACGDFKFERKQGLDSKNLTIYMRFDGYKKISEKEEVIDGKKVKVVTYSDKKEPLTYTEFEECLTDKKILEQKNGRYIIDHKANKAEFKYTSSNYYVPFEYDKKEDVKKSISVSFGYPTAYESDFPPLYGYDRVKKVPEMSCMTTEKIAKDTVYLHKGFDALIEDINKACSSGDAQKIADMRKTIGNAEALQDNMDMIKSALDAHYLVAAKAEATEIYKKMDAIERKMNKERDSMEEGEARKRATEYAALAKQLDELFLNPAIYRIETLMAKRESLDPDSAEIGKIDEEVKKLNADIREFYGRGEKSFSALYSVMEKFALSDSAKTIEDIRLKSYVYSRVFTGKPDKRGKPMSMSQANTQQLNGMKKFEKTLEDWGDQYEVSQGSTYPIKKAEKERQSAINKMNTRWASYEKKEYTDYNNYCSSGWTGSVKNPVKCKSFMSGMEKRRTSELKKREKDLLYIKGRNEKLDRMGTNYNDYQRKMASIEEDEEYDDYGASYSSYEDNFEDRYPTYSGPTTSTGYDANMYGMGGTSAMMGYGQQQQQMYNPYQQSQMYGSQQGYQYQMPQMQQQQQMGGWPSIR